MAAVKPVGRARHGARASLLIAAVGCTESPQPPVERDVWSVAPEPLLVIGANDERPGHTLHNVIAALRLSDGRIAVVNGGSSEVRFFSADGTLLATAGGRGRGPAEFPDIRSAALAAGDTIVLLTGDPAVAWVAPDANVVRKVPVRLPRFACRIAESPAVLADGSILLRAGDNPGSLGCPPVVEDVAQTTDLIARFDPATGAVDTLGTLPAAERDGVRYLLFGRTATVTASRDRIFAGETGGDTILAWSYDGGRVGSLRIPLEHAPVPDALRSQEPQRWRQANGRVVLRRAAVPEYFPRFGRLIVDRAGLLWVMAYPTLTERSPSGHDLEYPRPGFIDARGSEWVVLDARGKAVATVRMPPDFYAFDVGQDHVLGLVHDEYDVETVRLYSLQRPSTIPGR